MGDLKGKISSTMKARAESIDNAEDTRLSLLATSYLFKSPQVLLGELVLNRYLQGIW